MYSSKVLSYISGCNSSQELETYLKGYLLEIQSNFQQISLEDLQKSKGDIKNICCMLIDKNLIEFQQSSINIDTFVILIAEKLERLMMSSAILQIYSYTPYSSVRYRLKAAGIYLRVNDITIEYQDNFILIMNILDESFKIEEFSIKVSHTALSYYLTALKSYKRINRQDLLFSLRKMFLSEKNQSKYLFLKNDFLIKIIQTTNCTTLDSRLTEIMFDMYYQELQETFISIKINLKILEEKSSYSRELSQENLVTFNRIMSISNKYLQSLPNQDILYANLIRGTIIIEDENLLYQYLSSFGKMHKLKLYDAYKTFLHDLHDLHDLNIIDWGCGQGIGSILIFDFIREYALNIKIKNITLIEPSILAIQRAILHLNNITDNSTNIIPIQKDLDSVVKKDLLMYSNQSTTIHIFSNILDLETFILNDDFFEKISDTLKGVNYFVCVSPNLYAKRNNRLDLFYNYFAKNFDAQLISSRDSDIGKYKRYEKVFKVQKESI